MQIQIIFKLHKYHSSLFLQEVSMLTILKLSRFMWDSSFHPLSGKFLLIFQWRVDLLVAVFLKPQLLLLLCASVAYCHASTENWPHSLGYLFLCLFIHEFSHDYKLKKRCRTLLFYFESDKLYISPLNS